jgi:hypothetical protein
LRALAQLEQSLAVFSSQALVASEPWQLVVEATFSESTQPQV